jgi:hypothetical protein
MDDDPSIPEILKCNLLLKEQLHGIPKNLRDRFIMMLCEKLGVLQAQEHSLIATKLKNYFAALDAEEN